MDSQQVERFNIQPMSKEEIKCYSNCIRSKLLAQAVPFGGLAAGVYWFFKNMQGQAVRPGHSIFMGLCAGAFYHFTFNIRGCMKQTMAAFPDGYLASQMRIMERMETLSEDERRSLFESMKQQRALSGDYRSDVVDNNLSKPINLSDLDNAVPEVKGLEESAPYLEDDMKLPMKYESYEEMRRRNRESYRGSGVRNRTGVPAPDAVPSYTSPLLSEASEVIEDFPQPRKHVRTNKYGDVWEE